MRGEGRGMMQTDGTVPHLLFLKLTVGGLAVAMLLGLAVIAVILWTRLNAPALPELPEAVILPKGAAPVAVTFGHDRLIVVTDQDDVLIYETDGTLQQVIVLDQP